MDAKSPIMNGVRPQINRFKWDNTYSFDPKDSKKYGYVYMPYVYYSKHEMPKLPSNEEKYDYVKKMMKYSKTYEHLNEVLEKLTKYPEFQKLYKNSFLSTIETTTKLLEDGTTYMFTGDIPAMWLRDSSVQVQHYIKLLPCRR